MYTNRSGLCVVVYIYVVGGGYMYLSKTNWLETLVAIATEEAMSNSYIHKDYTIRC